MNMNLKPRLGDVLVRQTRPEEFVETKDASGKVVSVEQARPAEITMVNMSPASEGMGVLPILLAVGAAWMLAKG